MCFSPKPNVDTSHLDFQKEEAAAARAKEDERQARIAVGMGSISDAFGNMDPILAQRGEALSDFYNPQIESKFNKSKDELTFALARAGLLNSTTAGERQADLGNEFALQKAKVLGDIGADLSNTKGNIQRQQTAIEATLRASGDETAAANQALQSAVTFREDSPTFSPLGNIFAGIADGIGSYKAGRDVAQIQRAARANPLTYSSGRVVA